MHAPLPYGRFAEQAELSRDDAAAVELMMRRATNFKELSGLDSLKRVVTLPSGRQAAAILMGGVRRAVVFEPHERPEHPFDGVARTEIPMLFSGAILNAMVEEGEGVGIRLTEQARRRLIGYDADADLPPKEVALERFVVEYPQKFRYFEPRMTGIYTFTQYDKLRPTWYSGAMAQVVQVVSGYGRQDMQALPEDELERARMMLPERYMQRIRRDLRNIRLPGYAGAPDKQGRIEYDFHFGASNLVSFDSEDKPWLVRVSSAGVYAMPLPVVPATTTEAFREYIQEVGDDEILTILNRFGGLPSGEGFPAGNDFESWRRAGVVIEICDTADFYDYSSMYSACGWSVNSRGDEGFNTCWEFDGTGLMTAYGYKLGLSLGGAENSGLLPRDWDTNSQGEKQRLDEYLAGLYQEIGTRGARAQAIKYKLRRHSADEILARPTRNMQAEADYWDNLEMDPIASHSGYVNRVTAGPVYWPGEVPTSFGKLKFPTMDGVGCESLQIVSPDYKGPAVQCDTVLFGCYVNDGLQVVKYFRDERTFFREEQSTFEDCMHVGAWERTVTSGNSGLMGSLYTSAFDDRDEAPPVTTTTKIVGRDLGYGQAAYRTPGLMARVGSVTRARYYSRETEIETTSGFSLDVGVCIPVFERDAILYAYRESTTGMSWSKSGERRSVADPTSYQLWTHDPIFHYMGSTNSGNQGEPRPTTGDYVYVDSLVYTPTQCSDFADSGNWLGLSGYMDVSGICAPYTDREGAQSHHGAGVVIGGQAPQYASYSESGSTQGETEGRVSVSISVAGSVQVHSDVPDAWYNSFSPVDAGGSPHYFYRDATRIAIGESEYVSISETGSDGARRRWGHTGLVDNDRAYCFIGVINE